MYSFTEIFFKPGQNALFLKPVFQVQGIVLNKSLSAIFWNFCLLHPSTDINQLITSDHFWSKNARRLEPRVPFQLVCWCWCFAVAGAKYQQLVTENQQKTSKIPANPVFSIFFRKNIFKILFFIKYLLLSHLGTKQNFYFDVYLYQLGPKKSHFWLKTAKIQNFQFF